MLGPFEMRDIRRLTVDEMFQFSDWVLGTEVRARFASFPSASGLLEFVGNAHARLSATMNIVETEEVRLVAAKAGEANAQVRRLIEGIRDSLEACAELSKDEREARSYLGLMDELGLGSEGRLSWSAEADAVLAVEKKLTPELSAKLTKVSTPAGTLLEATREAIRCAAELRDWDGKRQALLAKRRPSVQASVSEARVEWLKSVLGFVNALALEAPEEKARELLGPFFSLVQKSRSPAGTAGARG